METGMMRAITQDGTARARARHAARSVVTQFGTLSAPLRFTPRFIIAGAQRCATTSVFRMLTQHPQVVSPVLNKGIHFFDTADRYARGPAFYAGHFPLRRPRNTHLVTGEASPYYIFHPLAVSRIATDLPDAHVIVLLRDPVERAYSAYKQELSRGFETLPSFEEALDAEPNRLAGEEAKLQADPAYHSFPHQHYGYISRGLYARQLRRAEGHLGRDRLTIIDLGALVDGDFGIWDRLIENIGIDPWRPGTMIRVNERPSSEMRPETRERLQAAFEQENAELSDYLGYIPSWCR